MIYCYMNGRLGNQMFYYAMARMLETLTPPHELIFNFKKVLLQHKQENDGFEDSLKYFNVQEYQTVNERMADGILQYGSIRQKIDFFVYLCCLRLRLKSDSKLFRSRVKKLLKSDIYTIMPFCSPLLYSFRLEKNKKFHKNIFISGPWENSSLFDDIRPTLLREFTPKQPPNPSNKALYEVIESSESICISVRRGDYESDPACKATFSVCHKTYFEQAIAVMQQKVKNPTFVMFSDDIEWVKNNLNVPGKVYYESGRDPVWEKMRLMYSCKHFIISNSTFSWWAQYLSRNPNKIVISPDRWFLPNRQWPLLEESFIKIKCE